jgi:uncharacterized protein YuzE
MRISYYAETDSLYIDLSERPSADSVEISDGIVLDYDEGGSPVGIDIDHASTRVVLDTLTFDRIPADGRAAATG